MAGITGVKDGTALASGSPRFSRRWMALWAVPAVMQLWLSVWFATDTQLGSPLALFWIVVIAASLCVAASVSVLVRSFATDEAELGALGTFFYCVSILPLVHGVTTPGVLVDVNSVTMASVFLAIPAGLIGAAPFSIARSRVAVMFRRSWRHWVAGWTGAVTLLSVAMTVNVDLIPAPSPRSPLTIAVAVASFVGCGLLSRRHLRMARVADRGAPLLVAAGYSFVGASAFVWLSDAPFSLGFWSAHAFDIVGVLGATVGALLVYRRSERVRDVMKPILVADPLAALEVGLDPIVHRFVADLEAKDPVTRDHVVRTAELAVRVGEELRLDPCTLRRVGITAVLHDVGKLNVPDAILNKPSGLTDEEFDVIRGHAADGANMVSESPAIADVADGIRSHHERIDGNGYPDGLVGDEIPLEARIVAACDAFDAMANTRQYRVGMEVDKVLAILREHAGSQWDADVVAAVQKVVLAHPPTNVGDSTLDEVGRIGCDCVPRELVSVD